MKANELMIDDWVYNKNIDKPIQIYPTIFSQMFRSNPNATTEDYNIFPITLTAEILEKNGFKARNRYIWEQKDNYCCIKLNIAPKIEIEGEIFGEPPILLQIDGATFSLNIIIEYVHELQHALRLCEIEKEIEL